MKPGSRLRAALPLAALIACCAPFGAARAKVPATGDLAAACAGRDGWSEPAPPARISDNTWYVGTCGITVLLVRTEAGLVLLDGGMADAVPSVLANIARLGFDPKQVTWIVPSHEHYDHVEGLAALQRATGAKVAALGAAQRTLETGDPSLDDPQRGGIKGFEPVRVDRVLADQDSVVVGGLALTVHATPAHSPGSASWSWQSCDAAFTCTMITYADSASTISADDYRFIDHPDRIAQVRLGLERMAALPCGVLVTPHPSASALFERLAGKAPLADGEACKSYAQAALARFEARLAKEAGKTAP